MAETYVIPDNSDIAYKVGTVINISVDIIESKIIGEDEHWVYGEKWRNGQKTTDWVRIKDDHLKAIGRAHTERVLKNSTNLHYAG